MTYSLSVMNNKYDSDKVKRIMRIRTKNNEFNNIQDPQSIISSVNIPNHKKAQALHDISLLRETQRINILKSIGKNESDKNILLPIRFGKTSVFTLDFINPYEIK